MIKYLKIYILSGVLFFFYPAGSIPSNTEPVFSPRCRLSRDNFIHRRVKDFHSVDGDSAAEPALEQIVSAVRSGWDRDKQRAILKQVEILYERLKSAGLSPAEGGSYLSAFSDYSPIWLELYLETVLSEEGLFDSEKAIKDGVLAVKKVIEVDNFNTLLEGGVLRGYPGLVSLLQSLTYDLQRMNFSQLLTEDKENILKVVAQSLPYKHRLGFYVAFQPQLYERYIEQYQKAYNDARTALNEQVRAWLNSPSIQALYIDGKQVSVRALSIEEIMSRFEREGHTIVEIWYRPYQNSELKVVEISLSRESVPLDTLIPIHKVSPDIGLGSGSFRSRSAEIDKGMLYPISVLRVIPDLRVGQSSYIANGNARALAYLEKGIQSIPAFVITVKGAPEGYVSYMKQGNTLLGFSKIGDVRLEPLTLPLPITIGSISAGVLTAQSDAELSKLIGDAIVKSIVDSVREKGYADVFISVKDLEILSKALDSNIHYLEYLEDWSKVRLFFYVPESSKLGLVRNIVIGRLWGTKVNINIAQTAQELSQLIGEKSIDFAISDFTTVAAESAVLSILQKSGTKTLLVISGREEGLLAQEMITDRATQVMGILNNPENLLLADASSIGSLLPQELKPAPTIIQLETFTGAPEVFKPIVSAIGLAVNQARHFGHPALVAIDGWLGSGRTGIVLKTLLDILKVQHPEYRITALNIDNYRLPEERLRKETLITIPAIGETIWSEINIGIKRIDSQTIAITTSFDEVRITIPAIGREVKLEEHAIFVKRKDANTLEIRLAPAVANVELGRFYRDIQRLREGEPAYVPLCIENKKVIIPEEERVPLVDGLIKMGEPLRDLEGRMLIYISCPEDSWKSAYPGFSFWVDTKTGDVFYEIEPSRYDLIFVVGELSLHQEKINALYSLRLFVDAEFSARVERLIGYHILADYYSGMTVAELKEYLEWQRLFLEDQFLFEDRERADYIILNNIYPDEGLLQQLYSMRLSARVERAIEVAQKEGVTEPWSILENYVLPVSALGSNFRTVLEFVINSHKEAPSVFTGDKIMELSKAGRAPFDLLNVAEYLLLYTVLHNLELIGD